MLCFVSNGLKHDAGFDFDFSCFCALWLNHLFSIHLECRREESAPWMRLDLIEINLHRRRQDNNLCNGNSQITLAYFSVRTASKMLRSHVNVRILQKRHTWTRRNKHADLVSTLLRSPCALSPAQTELTDLLSSIWSGFDLLNIWRWKDIIFEFRPQEEVITPTSLDACCNFRTWRPCQTSTSCHHLPGNSQNHGWVTAFRYFFLAHHRAPHVVE